MKSFHSYPTLTMTSNQRLQDYHDRLGQLINNRIQGTAQWTIGDLVGLTVVISGLGVLAWLLTG